MTLVEALEVAQTALLAAWVLRPLGARAWAARPRRAKRPAPTPPDPVIQQIEAVCANEAKAPCTGPADLRRTMYVQRCLRAAHAAGIDLSRHEHRVRTFANAYPLPR
jgi:hypothetical protein